MEDEAAREPDTDALAFEVSGEEAGARLDSFLASRLAGVSRTVIKRAADDGDVLVDGRAAKPSHKLRAGRGTGAARDISSLFTPSPRLPRLSPRGRASRRGLRG